MARAKKAASPDLEELRQQRDELEAKRQGLGEEEHRVRSLADPVVDNKPSASRAEVLRARARWPALRQEIALVEADLDEAQRALQAAEAVERQRLRHAYHAKKKPLVKALAAALHAAAEANSTLAELERGELIACGGAPSFLAWPELAAGTPTEVSRLRVWLLHVGAEGFDI